MGMMDWLSEYVAGLQRLFGVRITPEIVQVSTRTEFDRHYGKPSPRWVAGTARPGYVVVFSKDVIEEVAGKPASEWETLVKHEVAHLFLRKAIGRGPRWLHAGRPEDRKWDVLAIVRNALGFISRDYDATIGRLFEGL